MELRIVTAGVLEKDGAFLVGKRKPGGELSGKWEFPGGKVEPDEDERAGLVREFYEELGVQITVDDFLCSTRFTHSGRYYELRAFYVRLLTGSPVALEHEELAWIPVERMDRYDFAESDKAIVAALTRGGRVARQERARESE